MYLSSPGVSCVTVDRNERILKISYPVTLNETSIDPAKLWQGMALTNAYVTAKDNYGK